MTSPSSPVDAGHPTRMFDPDAYVGVGDFVRVLEDSSDWEIALQEKRSPVSGSATGAYHPDDIIVRARLRDGRTGQ